MKSKLKAVVYCTFAALVGASLGALDLIQHDRVAAAKLNDACLVLPSKAACLNRDVAVRSIHYTFNGVDMRDGNPVTAISANE
uniref:Uncharacterized protein n=1 Tax=Pseudomonas fluorescens (strain SBW25) TaxID=216595 RepID=A0A0G4E4V4_PSEFS|nr:hypothetical protein [Pseudomonas fluorescens]CEK41962.1 hypothetical protein PQBR57_0009 [Pseudomonas fluorescens SBW25]